MTVEADRHVGSEVLHPPRLLNRRSSCSSTWPARAASATGRCTIRCMRCAWRGSGGACVPALRSSARCGPGGALEGLCMVLSLTLQPAHTRSLALQLCPYPIPSSCSCHPGCFGPAGRRVGGSCGTCLPHEAPPAALHRRAVHPWPVPLPCRSACGRMQCPWRSASIQSLQQALRGSPRGTRPSAASSGCPSPGT